MPFGYSWGELGNAGLAGLDGPRQAIWNLGPALVGRSGQGPQNGAELFGRLGMDQQGPAAQGLGAGLDLVANPMNLAGMGLFNRATGAVGAGTGAAARTAAPEAAATLAGRLEQMAGGGLRAAEEASAVRAAQPIATQPGSQVAQQLQRMAVDHPPLVGAPAPMVSPQIAGRLDRAAGTGLQYQFGRAADAAQHAVMPNFPTPLATQSFGQGGAAAGSSTGGLLDRLQRMSRPAVQAMDY